MCGWMAYYESFILFLTTLKFRTALKRPGECFFDKYNFSSPDFILLFSIGFSPKVLPLFFVNGLIVLLSEPKKTEHKEIFRALKVSNICQQTFHNNFEHRNSACQPLTFKTHVDNRHSNKRTNRCRQKRCLGVFKFDPSLVDKVITQWEVK